MVMVVSPLHILNRQYRENVSFFSFYCNIKLFLVIVQQEGNVGPEKPLVVILGVWCLIPAKN